jgi:hypothetical protein
MENDYGYEADQIENRNKILGKAMILFLLAFLIAIAINVVTMFFDFGENNEDLPIIRASKYPLKIFIEKPQTTDQVGIYEVLEKKSPVKEKITPVAVEEPKKVKLAKSKELAKRVIDLKEVKKAESQDLKNNIISDEAIDDKGFKAQISAMSKKENAEKYWHKLKKDYPNLFKKLKYFLQKIDFPNRNPLFRLQIIGFKSEIEVEDFCLKFIHLTKQSHSNCIIISP